MRSQDVGDDSLACGFFNRKTNFAKKGSKFGLRMDFAGDKASVESMSAEDVESEERTLEKMALDMLNTGPMKIKELAEDLGATEGTIRNMLSRAKRKGKVTTPERGLWALATHESEPEERYWDK